MKPITPAEARKRVNFNRPTFVIDVINQLIVQNLTHGGTSRVTQDQIVDEIMLVARSAAATDLPLITRDKIFDNHWLDVEDIYREAGWNVKYDAPGIGDNYEAYFLFSEKRS